MFDLEKYRALFTVLFLQPVNYERYLKSPVALAGRSTGTETDRVAFPWAGKRKVAGATVSKRKFKIQFKRHENIIV